VAHDVRQPLWFRDRSSLGRGIEPRRSSTTVTGKKQALGAAKINGP
jgi:hypothetical protein